MQKKLCQLEHLFDTVFCLHIVNSLVITSVARVRRILFYKVFMDSYFLPPNFKIVTFWNIFGKPEINGWKY